MAVFPIQIIRFKKDLRAQVTAWHMQGLTVGIIPTMGALHHGHLSLVREIQKHVDKTIVSIFVNPKQFGPNEDFNKYPRQEAADLKILEEVNADILYAPQVAEIYPDGFLTTVSVTKITEGLCAANRPSHFDGVTTIVTKLLLQCLPDVAIFGEKDFQQYTILKQMVKDLDIPTSVISGKIVRDSDGLATSSRNVYLTTEERKMAVEIPKTLIQIIQEVKAHNQPLDQILGKAVQHLLGCGIKEVQYLEIRETETLNPIMGKVIVPSRLFIAAIVGKIRLIDNMPIGPSS